MATAITAAIVNSVIGSSALIEEKKVGLVACRTPMTRSKTNLSGQGSRSRKPISAKSAISDPVMRARCLRISGQK